MIRMVKTTWLREYGDLAGRRKKWFNSSPGVRNCTLYFIASRSLLELIHLPIRCVPVLGLFPPVIKRTVNEAKESHLFRGGTYLHFYISLHGVHREELYFHDMHDKHCNSSALLQCNISMTSELYLSVRN